MIKYIKSVLWRVAKCLSYIEEARCLKVNEDITAECGMFELFGQYDRNDARCTREIKCRIAMAKAAFSKATLVISKRELNLWKKLVQCLHLESGA